MKIDSERVRKTRYCNGLWPFTVHKEIDSISVVLKVYGEGGQWGGVEVEKHCLRDNIKFSSSVFDSRKKKRQHCSWCSIL